MAIDQRNCAPEVHVLSTSSVFLPDSSSIWRQPRRPARQRPPQFYAAFEDKALFYDCFDAGNSEIVLVGPPPLNLAPALKAAIFRALPSGVQLVPTWFPSRSTMTTVFSGVPGGTNAIEITIEGFTETIAVQPSHTDIFKGRRVMFTMNKDNDLGWIEFWARWHCQLHGVDAIVIFDNGSTRYGLANIATTLARVEGLKAIGLVSWPFRYGPVDPAVLSHPYWPNFLQVASFSLMLRRFGRESFGLLNCDIDELVGKKGCMDVFAALKQSRYGYVRLQGTWIEAVQDPEADPGDKASSHLDFQFRRKNPLLARCASKWALDPTRSWVQDYRVFPMMHRIYGLSRARLLFAPTLPFWHFRGVSTNWKDLRAHRDPPIADPRRHMKDVNWLDARASLLESKKRACVGDRFR